MHVRGNSDMHLRKATAFRELEEAKLLRSNEREAICYRSTSEMAGNRLAHPLFSKLFRLSKRCWKPTPLKVPALTIAGIGKFSYLLRPVRPAFMSQNASPGYHSHDPYRLSLGWAFTPTTG